ncbi:MAG TPA: DUF1566 domain-containing protein [Agitococcus sp.]|nr:DUF1566 domain-containing protein [Agitococcus sp.]
MIIVLLSVADYSYAQSNLCNSRMSRTAPDTRYQILSNGYEVIDKKTNLIWQRCSLGQTFNGQDCVGSATAHTWSKALQIAQGQGNGWRLPNVKELSSLIEEACEKPSINIGIFPNTLSEFYWTSTVATSIHAWTVHFSGGVVYIRDEGTGMNNLYYARLVRSVK